MKQLDCWCAEAMEMIKDKGLLISEKAVRFLSHVFDISQVRND
jgi:hypothetical protein